jgi:hypothetical protein
MTTDLLEPLDVAKRKTRKPAKEVVMKLPPEYGPILDAMKSKKGRAKTASVQMAIELLAKYEGIPFTPNWPDFLGENDSQD